MNKNLGIVLVLIGIIIVVVIAGFLVMQMVPKNNTSTATNTNPTTNGNSQSNVPSVNKPTTSTAKTYDVEIKNFAFSPSSLTIKKGDSVVWTNQDSVTHTIVSDSGTEINSGSLTNGGTYSHMFNNVGTYDYHCGIHPTMKAKIIVE